MTEFSLKKSRDQNGINSGGRWYIINKLCLFKYLISYGENMSNFMGSFNVYQMNSLLIGAI